jgi:alkylation response protein AidB-like acyl-CoA dehydrogenase
LPANPVSAARRAVDAAAAQPAISEAARLLADINELAPQFAARAEEIERGRRIPDDIVETLRRIGLFGALVPRSHGGLGLSFPDVLPVIAALAAGDGSIGWIATIGMNAQLFCSRLPRPTYDRVYGSGANPFIAGSGIPVGFAEIVDGGYRISGRWPLASGCQNARWLMGHCVVCKDGEPVISDDRATTLFILLPAHRWRIEDTWRSSGMAGSGSHHIALDDAWVSGFETFDPLYGTSCVPGPLDSVIAPLIASSHGATAIGIASGAIADLLDAANGRRQLLAAADLHDSDLKHSAGFGPDIFGHDIGRLGAKLRAARALLHVQTAQHWRRAITGLLDGKADFTLGLQGSAWIHAACTDIVSDCTALAGSHAIRSASSLQRRLRDIHAARQHFFAQERFYAAAGRLTLGFPATDPISGQPDS